MNAAKLLGALMGARVMDMGEFGSLDDLLKAVHKHAESRRSPEDYQAELVKDIERQMKLHAAVLEVAKRPNEIDRELVGLTACVCGLKETVTTLATYRNPNTGEHQVNVSVVGDSTKDKVYTAPDCCSASKIVRQIQEKMDDDAHEEAMAAAAAEAESTVKKAAAPEASQ